MFRGQEEEHRGRATVEEWKKNPARLPDSLGGFHATSLRSVVLRRILLALAIPADWGGTIGRFIRNPSQREKWDIFWKQYCFWRGVRSAMGDRGAWRRLTHGVPILMYHAFAGEDEPASRYIEPIRQFVRQMWLLKRLGYRVIALEEYAACLSEHGLPPERAVVLTIDDGYADVYWLAYPALKQFQFPATIFLVSSHWGGVNDWDVGSLLTGRPLIDATQAREMLGAGVRVGAHTRTHPWLSQIPSEQASDEVTASKAELQQKLDSPVEVFSYPHGDYNEATITIVTQAGFSGACTTDTGLNGPETSRFALRRVEIYGTFSLTRFLWAVWSGK